MMSDLTRYRQTEMPPEPWTHEDNPEWIFVESHPEPYMLVPDDTLQQIADAAKHRIYIDANGTDPDSEPWVSFDGSEVNGLRHCFDNVEIEYVLIPAALLEGLVNEVAPDQDPNHPNYMGEPTKVESFVKKLVDGQIALRDSEGEPT